MSPRLFGCRFQRPSVRYATPTCRICRAAVGKCRSRGPANQKPTTDQTVVLRHHRRVAYPVGRVRIAEARPFYYLCFEVRVSVAECHGCEVTAYLSRGRNTEAQINGDRRYSRQLIIPAARSDWASICPAESPAIDDTDRSFRRWFYVAS